MSKFFFARIFLFALFLFSFTHFGFSQACPTGCTLVSSGNTKTLVTTSPDCKFTITYDVYTCGGETSIKITGTTYHGSCDPSTMREFSIYHYNFSALNEFLSLAFLEDYAYTAAGGSLPNCSSGNFQKVVNIYTASCGTWIYCEYDVNLPGTCPSYWDGAAPDFNQGGVDKVRVYKWQSCGTVCCKRTYKFCWDTITGYTGIKAVADPPMRTSQYCTEDGPGGKYPVGSCQDGC